MSTSSAQPVVVAVDGPAGSGKSSVSRAAALALDFAFLDSGALYRAFAWFVQHEGVDIRDDAAIVAALEHFGFEIGTYPAGDHTVRAGDRRAQLEDVTDAIRTPVVTRGVGAISKVPAVRDHLTAIFRTLIAAAHRGIVVEGRDITTVVAPNAQVRVLLTASPEVRAQRRAAQLPDHDHDEVAKAIAARDARDAKVVDFMTAAPGVTELDSTDLDFEGTVAALVDLVHQHGRQQDGVVGRQGSSSTNDHE